VAITGTNGKSTTTRLISHVASEAGLRVGMTNSDGIYVQGELVEAGDCAGFGGAGRILGEPDLDLAVLETARGWILLRGIGYQHNDLSVVTNVSADHLGLQWIDTLDELAEVKGAVVASRAAEAGGAQRRGSEPGPCAPQPRAAVAFSSRRAPAVAEARPTREVGGPGRGGLVLAASRPPGALVGRDSRSRSPVSHTTS
jgi:hypothetical protein